MKQHLIYFFCAMLALATVGCTQDELDSTDGIELTVELRVASNMDTRSQRVLDGVNNWQHVTDVRVYIFHSATEDGPFTIYQPTVKDEEGVDQKIEYIEVDNFNERDDIYKEEEFKKRYVVIKPLLPEGYYKLLAIGVDEDKSLFDVVTPESTWDNIIKTTQDSPITSELFSGYSNAIHISSKSSNTFISIELKRCVAGILLYARSIPSEYDEIKLVLAGYSKKTDIVARSWVSEGETPETESDIILATFKAGDENEEFELEDGSTENRYYHGQFLLPCNTANMNNPTLRIDFHKSNGEVVTKKVKLINASDDDYDSPNLDIEGTHYNIIANRLYCIGFRSDKINEPVDLEKEEIEAKIIVYGSWQAEVNIPL